MSAPLAMTLALFAAFALAWLPLAAARRRRALASFATAGVMAGCLLLLAPHLGTAWGGETHLARYEWLPQWGLDFALRLDGFGALFALLILGIGLLVVLYAHYYLPEYDDLGRFFCVLLVFMGAMLGIVLAENLLLLVLFWEVTSISSFLLIAYKRELYDSRIAARMALAVTGGGGLALLAGVLILGHIVGSYDLSVVLASGDRIRSHALYAPALVLIMLGAFAKSAQFPFHFWLPNAMAAPTPVSAYLHSATMVKAGVFLIARLHPALAGTDLWFYVVGGAGAATLLYGAWVALYRHDLKGLLAYSTISHLGLITLLFGLDTPMSVVAGVFHIINHAIFKASLFMAAGIIDHECGTRDMRRINGLYRMMPVTATLAIIAAGSMAGVPLLNGFLSKEMFFAETVGHPSFAGFEWLLPLIATIAGVLSVAYSARFIHDVFFNGQPIDLPREPHEPPRWMRAPVEILVVLCLLVGILPQWSVATILGGAATAVLQTPTPTIALAVWHGFNLPLLMSFVAMVGGITVYVLRKPLFALADRMPTLHARVAFERFYEGLTALARGMVGLLDNGSVQRYAFLLFVFILALGGYAWWTGPRLSAAPIAQMGDLAGLGALGALTLAALGATVLHRRRLTAVVMVSVVGLVVALTFVRFSAPDLALTQLAVEVVTIVLLLLVLHYLPQHPPVDDSSTRVARDALLALAVGAGFGVLAYFVMTAPFETMSGYFLANSVTGGGGTNVVNVILVDFRGFDTLGEIAVLAMVGLAAHATLDRLVLPLPHTDVDGRAWAAERHPLFLQMLMRPLLPLALAVSVFIFLRGHNLPGGGFVAGLVTGVALILQYLASGIAFAQPKLPARTANIIGVGLALALGTGLASWAFDRPFLTSTHGYLSLPLLGDLHLASALVFDLGVYLVVVASVLMILSELGRLSQRGTETS